MAVNDLVDRLAAHKIDVDSTPGRTEFRVTLPIAVSRLAAAAE